MLNEPPAVVLHLPALRRDLAVIVLPTGQRICQRTSVRKRIEGRPVDGSRPCSDGPDLWATGHARVGAVSAKRRTITSTHRLAHLKEFGAFEPRDGQPDY